MTTPLTKHEAIEILAAHTAFEDHGGDRSDEWFAGRNEYDYPCASLRLSQMRHADQGTEARHGKMDPRTGILDQLSYALPDGSSPIDALLEVLEFDDRSDWYNADADEISDRMRDIIEDL